MGGFYDNIAAISARDLVLDWPKGANASDTILAGDHYNLTTLRYWNYTYYSNFTISNGSKCYLAFEPYQPDYLFPNGTFINNTKCYVAIKDIGIRGNTGIGFACVFGLMLMLLLTVLAKHGKTYLPRERRFYPIGRRWQWYWGLFVCATALISLFTNIDVDRYYLPELPLTVTVFFWFLMCMGTTAQTWEAVRHWGAWQERQYIDPNPFVYAEDDRRAKVEFWLPLWVYFWIWMNFFMVVPRSWSFSQKQRSPEQTAAIAAPGATSIRFKVAAFCLVIAWATIVFSMRHSISHYRSRQGGIFRRAFGFTKAIPLRFYLIIPACAGMIAYQGFIAWVWEFSIIRKDGPVAVIYGWGYGPSLFIIIIQVIYGFASPNEDKDLIRQRRERGDAIDRELGIVKKPAWWRRVRGEHLHTLRDKITMNVNEIGGGRATGRRIETAAERDAREEALASANNDIEMNPVSSRAKQENNPRADRAGVSVINHQRQHLPTPYEGKSDRRRYERSMQAAAGILFPNSQEADRRAREAELGLDGPAPPPYSDRAERGRNSNRPGSTGRSNSAETTNSITAPPQQVRSMLDI
ncbi:hypothetical protein B0J13DRAFT_136441 [Dactylonectria estremocensis]|uniref:Uncharacterized protein n=1 Tax=Dactylonectria estremocensis TaxID=1079267 RepID=A0A9P9DZG6_9HYPO|nr:hypothetical protein B0J13DRAFT_136441 [Dactylonectria estremocensis]